MKLREEISSEGLERPEKEPVALSQRKTGGSPERSIEREQAPQWGVATIEIAVSASIEDAEESETTMGHRDGSAGPSKRRAALLPSRPKED